MTIEGSVRRELGCEGTADGIGVSRRGFGCKGSADGIRRGVDGGVADWIKGNADAESWANVIAAKVQQAKDGDEAAVTWVIEAFRPLVMGTARKYRDVAFEDARQEGFAALLAAIRLYRVDRGVPFAAYAARKVHGDVRTAMRRLWKYDERTRGVGNRDRHGEALDSGLMLGGRGGLDAQALETGMGATVGMMAALGAGATARMGVMGAGSTVDDRAGHLRIELMDAGRRAGLSQREWLWLECALAGLGVSESARQHGVSVDTMRSWRKRAMAKMRAELVRD